MIPQGMTEAQVIQIINNIANRLAGKFKFGYHDLEDMKQQARLFAWEGMENYDGIRPLENFLWTHVRNRLYNFKRNNFGRPDKPCDSCPFFDISFSNDKGYGCKAYNNHEECDLYLDVRSAEAIEETLDKKNIFNLVDKSIPVQYREDWVRFVNNLKLPKIRREAVVTIVMNILKENNIDTETW